MDLDLKGKVAIVTGSGWGIGKATALALANEGASVVISDIDEQRGNSAVAEVKALGVDSVFIKADVSKASEVKQLADSSVARFHQIDILVNNAGVWRINPFMMMKQEDWDLEIAVNYYGTLLCTRAVLEHMIPRKSGCIINLGSDAGRVGEAVQPVYSGAKGAVIAFSKALAKDVGRHGIRVNVVSPGSTTGERRLEMEAQMHQEGNQEKIKAYEQQRQAALRLYPLRKFGKPEDIANMIVFLASGKCAGHITGQTISVDGGYCMP